MGTKAKKKLYGKGMLIMNMRDYSSDPFFKKRHEEAIEFLKRTGIPDFGKKTTKHGTKSKEEVY